MAQARPTVPDIFAPPPFKGESAENAQAWVEQLERYVKCRNLTNDEKKDFFPLFLRDLAIDWFDGLDAGEKDTFAHIVESFKKRYVPADFDIVLAQESVFARCQKQGETARDYVAQMQKLARRLPNVTGDTLRYVIVRGLLPHVKRYVVQQDAQTIEDVLKAARIAELSTSAADTDLGELVAEVRASRAEVRQLSSRVNGMTVNSVEPPPNRSPTPQSPSASRRVTFGRGAYRPPHRPQSPSPRGQWNQQTRGPAQQRNQTSWNRNLTSGNTRMCGRCGKHPFNTTCRFLTATCYKCQGRGHISAMCRSGRRNAFNQH
jgi:hypothetical protein